MDDIKKCIMKHLLQDDIDEADLFFCLKKSDKNVLFTGEGTDKSHFKARFRSVKLLKKLDNIGMFHVNCTYKIIKYFYPLLALGITDFDHHFHPIAFMVTSHETEEDFKYFFTSLDEIAKELKIE